MRTAQRADVLPIPGDEEHATQRKCKPRCSDNRAPFGKKQNPVQREHHTAAELKHTRRADCGKQQARIPEEIGDSQPDAPHNQPNRNPSCSAFRRDIRVNRPRLHAGHENTEEDCCGKGPDESRERHGEEV